MNIQSLIEQSLINANQLHHNYNTYETQSNIEYIKHLIEKINELKIKNRELTLNYNELFFDFANYKSEKNDNEMNEMNQNSKPDAIDIY